MVERDQEYAEFVASAGTALRRTAYLVCGDWHRADDVVQDALYKLYVSWPKVVRSSHPFAYARRVVVNAALDSGRRPWRREVPTDRPPDRAQQSDSSAAHADRDEIQAVLVGLPPRQRACVVLRYYEDLSVDQTAELLGVSPGTVKSQAARGLATLRNAIDQARERRS
ncbi:RNA polymerase sigma-70 factor (sigma-E family) [Kribbella amoyensis]|uniref:RNA polymerase sigma-70 factor (Sigma-E family) n=1 Tax=Kribbella amoyensis TaxID=996641 RepID=A0A561BMK9_9ACTN|nr:SigE family RNA polymerase sigma factor [Kribbella amoyensis]TWD80136.1 RNA polymerase sigma-70 factor (sigma-E family) [Kribbella amoyensis]